MHVETRDFRPETVGRFLIVSAGVVLGVWLAQLTASAGQAAVGQDRMSFLDNGALRLGVDLDLGGAITCVSASGTNLNLINNHDWGRQIQMSHYSGPVPYAPDGKMPKEHWKKLGWNPIQSGDCFGNRSQVISSRNDGRSLYLKCAPKQWPLDNVSGDCEFETWIRLEQNTAQVRCRLTNHRPDTTQYPARMQELPAVYVNGPWYRLITYAGEKPFTGDALTRIEKKFEAGKLPPWAKWMATENWAAFVDDRDWGLGVWHPGVFTFLGGFVGQPGKGGSSDNQTGYICPARLEILDHNIVYDYEYALILGNLNQIRRHVYDHARKIAPPVWHFEKDRAHWHYTGASDTGWPLQSGLHVLLDGKHPHLISPDIFCPAVQVSNMWVTAAFDTCQSRARVFWTRYDAPSLSLDRSLPFEVQPDKQFHTCKVPLGTSPEYRGVITGVRLAPVPDGGPSLSIRVKSISFRKP
jgi:hypothetical protein